MITDLTRDETPSGRSSSQSTVPKNKSGAMPKSFMSEYKDKKIKGEQNRAMSDMASSIKQLTNEMKSTRAEMKRGAGGMSNRFNKADKEINPNHAVNGGSREMAASAKHIAASTREFAKQTNLFTKAINKFGMMSKGTTDRLSRTANRLASTAAAGGSAAGRGVGKAAGFAGNSNMGRQFENDMNDMKESAREQMINMLFMGNPLLSYMGQGAIKGMSPAVKKAWQKMKGAKGGGGQQGALMRHQGGLIFAHEGNVIQDPKGQKRSLQKDEHVTVLKEGEMVLPTHQKSFMQKFSRSISEGVVEAQDRRSKTSNRKVQVTSSTPAVELPQSRYFTEMQKVLEDSQKMMTLNTYGTKAGGSGLKTAFAHAVVPFAGKFKRELPNTERMGVLGGMLSTLSSMYAVNRAQSSDLLQQVYQLTRITQSGLGVAGKLRKPKSMTLSEAIIRQAKWQTIGKAKEKSKKFGDNLLGTKRVIGGGALTDGSVGGNVDKELHKLIKDLTRVTYISGVAGAGVPTPTARITMPQLMRNSVRAARVKRAATKKVDPKKTPGSHGFIDALKGRGMMAGDKIGGMARKVYESESPWIKTMMKDQVSPLVSGYKKADKRVRSGSGKLKDKLMNSGMMNAAKGKIQDFKEIKQDIGTSINDMGEKSTTKNISFWTRRYKAQIEDWASADSQSGMKEGLKKIHGLARSLVPDSDEASKQSIFKELRTSLASVYKKKKQESDKTGNVVGKEIGIKDNPVEDYESWSAKMKGDWRKTSQSWGGKRRRMLKKNEWQSEDDVENKIGAKPVRPDMSEEAWKSVTDKRREAKQSIQTNRDAQKGSSNAKTSVTVDGTRLSDDDLAGATMEESISRQVIISREDLKEQKEQGKEQKKQTALLAATVADINEDEDEEGKTKKKGMWNRMFGGLGKEKGGAGEKKGKGIMGLLSSPWMKVLGMVGAGFAIPGLGALFGGKSLGKMGKSAMVGSLLGGVLGLAVMGPAGAVFGAGAGAAIGGMVANSEMHPIEWVGDQIGMVWKDKKAAGIGAIIGGTIGLVMGGPLGAMAGAVVGGWAVAKMRDVKKKADSGEIDSAAIKMILPDTSTFRGSWKGALVGGVMGMMVGGPPGGFAGAAFGSWAYMKGAEFMGDNPESAVTKMWKGLGLSEHSVGASAGATIGAVIGFMFGGPVGMVAGAAAGSLVGSSIARIMSMKQETEKEQLKQKGVFDKRDVMDTGDAGSISSTMALAMAQAQGKDIGNKKIGEMRKKIKDARKIGLDAGKGLKPGSPEWKKAIEDGLVRRNAALDALKSDPDYKALSTADKTLSTEIKQAKATKPGFLKRAFVGGEAEENRKKLVAMDESQAQKNLATYGRYQENAGKAAIGMLKPEDITDKKQLAFGKSMLKDAEGVFASYDREANWTIISTPNMVTGGNDEFRKLNPDIADQHAAAKTKVDNIKNQIEIIQLRMAEKEKKRQAKLAQSQGGMFQSAYGAPHGIPSDGAISPHMGGPLQDAITTSGFGNRLDPITGKPAFHDGVDMVGSSKQVTATNSGMVMSVGRMGQRGNVVEVLQQNGKIASYDHLASTNVKQGEWIDSGSLIGQMGSTGRSTGAHLHYKEEMMQGGQRIPVAPMGGVLNNIVGAVKNSDITKTTMSNINNVKDTAKFKSLYASAQGKDNALDQYGKPIQAGVGGGIMKVMSLFKDLLSKIFGGMGDFLGDQFRAPEKYGSVADKFTGAGLGTGYDQMFKGAKFGEKSSGRHWLGAVGNMIKMHESGNINKPNLTSYKDTRNHSTIGFGHKIKKGESFGKIDGDRAQSLFDDDLNNAIGGLLRITGAKDVGELVKTYGPYRTAALVDMSYNLGAGSMGKSGLGGFMNMWENLDGGDFLGASAEILDSKYRDQVKDRAVSVAQLMATGPESGDANSPNFILNMLKAKAGSTTGGGNVRSTASQMYESAMGSGITGGMIAKWTNIKNQSKSLLSNQTFWPPTSGTVSSPFGNRNGGHHNGLDFDAAQGSPISSVWPGVVEFVGKLGKGGNGVIVKHAHGLYSKYMHMVDGSFKVSEGDAVNMGTELGGVGATGGKYKPHLHFEIGKSGRGAADQTNAIDPSFFFSTLAPGRNMAGSASNAVKSFLDVKPNPNILASTSPPSSTVMDPSMGGGPQGTETVRSPINGQHLVNLQVNRDAALQHLLGSEVGKKTSGIGKALDKFANSTVYSGITNNNIQGGNTTTGGGGGGTETNALQGQVEAVMEAILDGRGYLHS